MTIRLHVDRTLVELDEFDLPGGAGGRLVERGRHPETGQVTGPGAVMKVVLDSSAWPAAADAQFFIAGDQQVLGRHP